MSEFVPIRTAAELARLDQDDITAGYRSGLNGDPEPGSDRSRGFWHGWRNGHVDAGYAQPDAAQAQLAQDIVIRRSLAVGGSP